MLSRCANFTGTEHKLLSNRTSESELPGLGAQERAIIRVMRELINEPQLSARAFVEVPNFSATKE